MEQKENQVLLKKKVPNVELKNEEIKNAELQNTESKIEKAALGFLSAPYQMLPSFCLDYFSLLAKKIRQAVLHCLSYYLHDILFYTGQPFK